MKINLNLEKGYIEKGYWEKITLGESLKQWSTLYSDQIAIIDGQTKITYENFNNEVNRLGAGLKKLGLVKGDKVVLQMPNSVSFIITSFALFRIGVIPVMALPAHRETELRGIFKVSEASAYIIKDKYLGYNYINLARELKKENSNIKNVIVDGQSEEFISLESILNNNANAPIDEEIDFREIAILLLSGGTTGIPKLIPRRHTDYLYVAKTLAEKCSMDEKSIYLAVLPIAHNFPLGCPGIIGTFTVGGTVVICHTPSPDEILPLIEEENVTITGVVPTLAGLCMEFLQLDSKFDLSSLKIIQVGGSVLDAITSKKIMDTFGCTLQQIYGIAEGLICCTRLDDSVEVISTCQGKPISAGDEVHIVDEDGKDVKDGEVGELIVRGPYTILGYYNLPEVNTKSFNKEKYYLTGDKACITPDGNYQILGRIKEQINRSGEKITPSELEELLCRHKMIKEASVVGVPDNSLGERICAFLITDNQTININEIREFLVSQGLATFKMPDQVEFINSWPLTSVGKINKEKLKDLAQIN